MDRQKKVYITNKNKKNKNHFIFLDKKQNQLDTTWRHIKGLPGQTLIDQDEE